MPDTGSASEYGGKIISRHGVQPAPHIPTPSERLGLLYRTGDESGLVDVDSAGDVWSGALSLSKQTAIREAEGVLAKGQVWEELQAVAAAEIEELRSAE